MNAIPLAEVLTQITRTVDVKEPAQEKFLTIRLRGAGVIQRRVADGKTPKRFTGYRVSQGQFIYSRIDARNGAFGMVPVELDGAVVSKDFPIFELDNTRVDLRYWNAFIRRPELASIIARKLSFGATNRQRVSEEAFLRLTIPLPDLSEQRRIADILDKVDGLRAKCREAIARLDSLGRSIYHEMFGDPISNPKSWPEFSLGELGQWQSGGTPLRAESSYFGRGHWWYTSGELNSKWLHSTTEEITDKAIRESSAKLIPAGALLLGMYDTAALKSGITTQIATCNQAIAFGALDKSRVSVEYVYETIQCGKEQYRAQQRGVRQKNLNLSMVKGLKIPVPPLRLQDQFDGRMKIIGDLTSGYEEELRLLDNLFLSLQDRAFKGEL